MGHETTRDGATSDESMRDQVMREPQQDRSRRTLERILDASVEILAESGWDGVTVGEVERRSGVSRGAFYARFPTREALLDYVREQVLERVAVEQASALDEAESASPSTLPAAVLAAVSAISAVFIEHGPVLTRLGRGPSSSERGLSSITDLSDRFTRIVSPHLSPGPESQRALQFCLRTIFDSLVARTREPDPFVSHAPLSWEQHVEALAELVTDHLVKHEAAGSTPA